MTNDRQRLLPALAMRRQVACITLVHAGLRPCERRDADINTHADDHAMGRKCTVG